VEPKGFRRGKAGGSVHEQVALTAEPSAAHVGEPRETRKGAAVSWPLWVLEVYLARAGYSRSAFFLSSMEPRTGAFFFLDARELVACGGWPVGRARQIRARTSPRSHRNSHQRRGTEVQSLHATGYGPQAASRLRRQAP